jgi:cytosine/uracil/thiamine/allantoin permease
MMPVCLTLTAFLSVTMASASVVIYDLDAPAWNPLKVVGMFHSHAAQFFVSLIFAFATLCTNIAGNSVAFGNHLSRPMSRRNGFTRVEVRTKRQSMSEGSKSSRLSYRDHHSYPSTMYQ